MEAVKNNPVVTAGGLAGALVALAAVFGVILDTDTLETILAGFLPVIAAVAARHFVTPTRKLEPPSTATPLRKT